MSEWVKCADRLPPREGWYQAIASGWLTGWNTHWNGHMWSDGDDFEVRDVTHWMPLPEPPKED